LLKLDGLTLIGKFGVDSGQAMVGDPCYLDDWKKWDREKENFDEYPNHAGEYSYLGACHATLSRGHGVLGGMSAVAFNTGYGDGLYPVFAKIEDGRVMKIVIDFEGDIDDEGEIDEY
jgi:hypothetical protein